MVIFQFATLKYPEVIFDGDLRMKHARWGPLH